MVRGHVRCAGFGTSLILFSLLELRLSHFTGAVGFAYGADGFVQHSYQDMFPTGCAGRMAVYSMMLWDGAVRRLVCGLLPTIWRPLT